MRRTLLGIVVVIVAGFFAGWQARAPQVTEAQRIAREATTLARQQSDAAKGWEAQYQQVYPLVRQWRMGYESLKKRCGE